MYYNRSKITNNFTSSTTTTFSTNTNTNTNTNNNIINDDGHAIPMVNYDLSQRKFLINPDAEKFIRSLPSPLGVISVAGMYRTGKSYLLNRMLLNRSNGFSVGPSINPCTKGLWMWNKTIPAHTPNGEAINVIIIDTEGIGATDEDQNHDNKIMTLAILLSSYFIYNSLGTIDENAIQNLSFIVNITKNIQNKNNDKDFALYLPSFMWVIRDFSLQLKNSDGKTITSKEYLEKSLEIQKGSSEFINSKNQIRQLVKEYFPTRDCVTLVRPLTEEGNLQNLENTDSSKLRKEFIEQVNYLRKTVMNSIKPKKLNGNFLNGEMFINLLNSYVNMINKGAVPVIKSAWTLMCESECVRVIEEAVKKYKENVDKIILPMDEKKLKLQLKKIKKDCVDFYYNEAIGDFDDKKIKELKEKLRKEKINVMKRNVNLSKDETLKFINENFKEIDNKVKNNVYKNISDYKFDVKNFIKNVNENCNGPNKEITLYKFLIKNILDHNRIFSKNKMNEMTNLININKIKMENIMNEVNNNKNKNKDLINEVEKLKEKLFKLTDENKNINNDKENQNEKINNLINEKNNEIKNLKEKLNNIEKNNINVIKEFKEKVNQAEKNLHENEIKTT